MYLHRMVGLSICSVQRIQSLEEANAKECKKLPAFRVNTGLIHDMEGSTHTEEES